MLGGICLYTSWSSSIVSDFPIFNANSWLLCLKRKTSLCKPKLLTRASGKIISKICSRLFIETKLLFFVFRYSPIESSKSFAFSCKVLNFTCKQQLFQVVLDL